MVKYRKKPIVIDAELYVKGMAMEDGIECSNSLVRGLCQDSCGSCPEYKPYIKT